MNNDLEEKKKKFTDEVARIAQEMGAKLHAESVSFVTNKQMQPGEVSFIVQEADTARLLAIHQVFAAMTVRWRHHLLVCGVPPSIVTANELQGVKIGADDNAQNDAMNKPKIWNPN